MKLPELHKFLLKIQAEIDRLTQRLKRQYTHDHDYWDGYNDALLKCQADLEKLFKL